MVCTVYIYIAPFVSYADLSALESINGNLKKGQKENGEA